MINFVKGLVLSLMISAGILSQSVLAQTVDIEVPVDELPSERVMPKLDSPLAVRSRILSFADRFEVRMHTGWFLDDPFYNNQYFGASVLFNKNEEQGFGLKYQSWAQGLSKYSAQLQSVTPSVRLERAPAPDSSISALYEYKAFYGKISFSQEKIIQFAMGAELEAGMVKYGSEFYPRLGISGFQKFFFTQNWGAQLDYRLVLHEAIDPNSVDLRQGQPVPIQSDFETVIQLSHELNLSLIYLF